MKRDLKHKIANVCGISILALGIGLSFAKPAIELTQAVVPQTTVFAKKVKGGGGSKKTDKESDKKTDKESDKKKGGSGDGGDGGSGGGGDSSGQGDSYSFYHLASSAATYFDASQNPDITDIKFRDAVTMSQPQYFGNAGGFIGYEDSQYDKQNWIGSVTSALSSSAQGHSYNTYPDQDEDIGDTSKNGAKTDKGTNNVTGATNDLYYYALFGHALANMGLDSTAPQEGITSIFRWLFGIIMMIFYAAAISVPLIFAGVGKFLQIFNPFQFFAPKFIGKSPATYHFADPFARASDQAGGLVNSIPGVGEVWKGLSHFLGDIYTNCQEVGLMVTIPACIIIAMTMLVLGRASRGRGVSMLKKVLIRAVIIMMGVPIFADFYTSAVNQLSLGKDTNIAANTVLGSTFDDFEDWAANTRLALPVGTSISVTNLKEQPEGQVVQPTDSNSKTTTDVRTLSRKINSIAGTGLLADDTDNSDPSNNVWEDAKKSEGMSQSEKEMRQHQLTAGFLMLAKYISGAKFTAAQYETQYKSNLSITPRADTETNQRGSKAVKGSKPSAGNSARAKILKGIKYLAADPGTFYKDGVAYFTPNQQPKDSKNGWVNFLWNAGSTGNGKDANSVGTTVNPGTQVVQAGSGSYDEDKQVDDAKGGTIMFKGNGKTHHSGDDNYNYGLSSLSLYNYLTTEFSDSTITVYSPNKISSMFVMKEHHSVNLVGSGINQVCYYLNALVLFIAITIIGWGYALATLTGVLSSELRSLMHMPVMLSGGLNAAAKFFATVMVMIIQIFTTIFLYEIAIQFLEVINIGSSPLFKTAANNIGSGGRGSGVIMFAAQNPLTNVMGTLIYLIIATLITLGMSIVALKSRGKFVRAMSEWVGDLIDKLLMTGTYNPQISNSYMTQNGGASQEIQNSMDNGDNLSQGFNDGMSTGDNNNTEGVSNNNANSDNNSTEVNNGGGSGSSPSEAKNATGDDGGESGGAKGFGNQGIPAEAANGDSEGTPTAETKGNASSGQANGSENQASGPINESEINADGNSQGDNQASAQNANADQAGAQDSVNNDTSSANNASKTMANNQGSPSTHATSENANNNDESVNHSLENNATEQMAGKDNENTEPRSNQGAAINHDGTGSGSNSDNASGEAPEQSAINADSQNNEINQTNGDIANGESNSSESQLADGTSPAVSGAQVGQDAIKGADTVGQSAVNAEHNMGENINPDNSVNNDNNADSQSNEINQTNGDIANGESNNSESQSAEVTNPAVIGAAKVGQEALKGADTVRQSAVNAEHNMGENINPDNSINNDNNVDNSQDNDSASSMVRNDPLNKQSADNSNNLYNKSDARDLNNQQIHQNAQNVNSQNAGTRNLNAQNSQNKAGQHMNVNGGSTNMHNMSNETSQNSNANNAPKSINNLANNNSNSPKMVNSSVNSTSNAPKTVNSSANNNANGPKLANSSVNSMHSGPKNVNSSANNNSNSSKLANSSVNSMHNAPKNVNSRNSSSKVNSVNSSRTVANNGMRANGLSGSHQSAVKATNGMRNSQNNLNASRANAVNGARGAQSSLNVARANGINSAKGAQSSLNGARANSINNVKGAQSNLNGTRANGINSTKGAQSGQMNTGTRSLNQSAIKMPNGQMAKGQVASLPKQTAQNGQIRPMSAQTVKNAQVNAEKSQGVRQGMNKPYQYTPNRTFAKGLAQKAIGAGKIIATPATLARTGSISATMASMQNGRKLINQGNSNIASARNMRQTAHMSRESINNVIQQAQSKSSAVSGNANNGRPVQSATIKDSQTAQEAVKTADAAEQAGQTAQAAQDNAIHAPEKTAPLDLDDVSDNARDKLF